MNVKELAGVMEKNMRVNSPDLRGSECDGLLYAAVQWFNCHPVLDGMPYFATKAKAIDYARKHEEMSANTGFNVTYTIIRLEKGM